MNNNIARFYPKSTAPAVPNIGSTETLFDSKKISADDAVLRFLDAQASNTPWQANYISNPLPRNEMTRIHQIGFELNARTILFTGGANLAANLASAVGLINALHEASVEVSVGNTSCQDLQKKPLSDYVNFDMTYQAIGDDVLVNIESYGPVVPVKNALELDVNDRLDVEVTFNSAAALPAAATQFAGLVGGDLRLKLLLNVTRYTAGEKSRAVAGAQVNGRPVLA